MRARDAAKLKKGDTIFLNQWGIGIVTVEKVTLKHFNPDYPEEVYIIESVDRFGKTHKWTHLYYRKQ